MVARIVAVMFLANAAFNAFGQEAVRVAKVDFREIEPLLLEAAFAKPENAELKKSYEATQQKQKEMMGRMLDAQKSGAFNPMEFARDFASKPWDTEKAARNLARGELIAVIEEI